MHDDLEGKHGVQSLEVGMSLLKAMVAGQQAMMLKDIAAAADMPASKAHRYLVSLIRSGLVEQDPLSSRYTLGPFALNLGLVALGYITRMTRSFLLYQLRQDYTTVLRLKGLSESAILWRHALRNAAGPVLAIIALTSAYLLEGAVLTETVFAWPGLGMYITDSLFASDIPAVLAATLLVGSIFMLVNIASELIQSALDPRSRLA